MDKNGDQLSCLLLLRSTPPKTPPAAYLLQAVRNRPLRVRVRLNLPSLSSATGSIITPTLLRFELFSYVFYSKNLESKPMKIRKATVGNRFLSIAIWGQHILVYETIFLHHYVP